MLTCCGSGDSVGFNSLHHNVWRGTRNIRIFHKYDRDDSGQLNLPEFTVALNDLGYPAAWQHVSMVTVSLRSASFLSSTGCWTSVGSIKSLRDLEGLPLIGQSTPHQSSSILLKATMLPEAREEDVRMLMEEVNICNPVAGIAGSDEQVPYHHKSSIRSLTGQVEVFRFYVSGLNSLSFSPSSCFLLLTSSNVILCSPVACHFSISHVCNAQPWWTPNLVYL